MGCRVYSEEVAHNQNSMHSDLAASHTEHTHHFHRVYDVHSLCRDIIFIMLTQWVCMGIVQFL